MSTQAADIDASKAPLLAHLTELRRRLLYCLGLFLVAFVVAYYFADYLFGFLTQPLVEAFGNSEDRRMIYTGLHEAFFTYIKLAFFAAACVVLPFVLNQVWKFLAPGMYEHERRSLWPAFAATPLLFALGAALAFYGIFPLAWGFFLGFENPGMAGGVAVELEARVSEYLSLATRLILAFGLSFELPVLLLVLAKVGLVSADTLRRHRKYAIVAAFLLAALITPPDLISQIALGTPIVLLYELSIWMIVWTKSDTEARAREAALRAQ